MGGPSKGSCLYFQVDSDLAKFGQVYVCLFFKVSFLKQRKLLQLSENGNLTYLIVLSRVNYLYIFNPEHRFYTG